MSAVQKHLQAASAGVVRSKTSGFAPSASPVTGMMLKREKGGFGHDHKLVR